ncbi:MAG: lysophospholipid acyltransferase family protein [Solirubrobacteraceae bacterium]
MTEPHGTESEGAAPDQAGVTVELSLRELVGDGVPARRGDLREHLPGLEPERQITDWGRSERVEGLVDRTIYDFLYHYWFRVEVEGVENVADDGGALLVCNHAGALPPDGIMIAKALREEHPRRRAVHLALERPLRRLPGAGMLIAKVGGVPAHPANIQRLLFDEQQLVLAFPEGSSGTRKPISERYRLRKFGEGGFVAAAMRARVPIIPIAVLGAEEAQPVFGRLNPLRRLPYLPLTTALPLPAKFRIRFLEAIATDDLGATPDEDERLVRTMAHDVRALIQENLLELVAARRSVWLG